MKHLVLTIMLLAAAYSISCSAQDTDINTLHISAIGK